MSGLQAEILFSNVNFIFLGYVGPESVDSYNKKYIFLGVSDTTDVSAKTKYKV